MDSPLEEYIRSIVFWFNDRQALLGILVMSIFLFPFLTPYLIWELPRITDSGREKYPRERIAFVAFAIIAWIVSVIGIFVMGMMVYELSQD